MKTKREFKLGIRKFTMQKLLFSW